jgi:hypothetical protein
MYGIEDMEFPRVRARLKVPTVGDLGVGSVARDDLRACSPPNDGPAVLAPPPLPKSLDRAFDGGGVSARGGAGLESKRMVLAVGLGSSWAIMILQSLGNSRSISGRGPSWPLPRVRDAPYSGYGCPSGWLRVFVSG